MATNPLVQLHMSDKTVFTTEDLAIFWDETNRVNLKKKISYHVKHGGLVRLRGGIFAKDKEFNPKELATKIITPAYVSFETVLREAGVIFQHYETIYVASYKTKTVKTGGVMISFRKIKNEALYNNTGVITDHHFSQATPERAFLDMIYLFPRYYFDNLSSLKWNVCEKLAPLYGNKQLIKRLARYRKQYAE